MAERLIVRVGAPFDRAELLSVKDAFEQVLELFELSSASDKESADLVIWKLVSASTNSPLTVVAEAVSSDPGVNIDVLARSQKQAFARNVASMNRGEVPKDWAAGHANAIMRSVCARTLSDEQVGATVIVIDDDEGVAPIALASSENLIAVIEYQAPASNQEPVRIKEQIGSIEGRMNSVSTHYGKPAISLTARITGKHVWCIVTEEHLKRMSSEAQISDVWSNKRVVVSGRLVYDQWGQLQRVYASSLRRIENRDIPLERIIDRDFTGGLSSEEYLDLLREGHLG